MDKATEAAMITKALGYTENGGQPDIRNPKKGKSGEMKSIFQYTPDTWKGASEQIFGKSLPMTPGNEALVTINRVHHWLDKGYTPQQIFSMWNAGASEPNAYEGKFSDGSSAQGINKHGVRFDVPEYVNKAMSYFHEFSQSRPMAASAGAPTAFVPPQGTPPVMQGAQTPQPISNGQSMPITQAVNPSLMPPIVQGKQSPGLASGLINPTLNQSPKRKSGLTSSS